MRALSIIERELISRMVTVDESGILSVLSNVIDPSCGTPCLPDDAYVDLSTPQSMTCWIAQTADPVASEERVLMLLTTVALLCKELESLGLVHFAGNTSVSRLGDWNQSIQYNSTNFVDADLGDLLWPYTQKRFWVSEELRELSKREYQSQEEVRHKKELQKSKVQLNLTRVALGLSLVGIVVSVVAPRYATTMVDFANPPVQTRIHVQEELPLQVRKSLESLEQKIKAHTDSLEDASGRIESVAQQRTKVTQQQGINIVKELQVISQHLASQLSLFQKQAAHNKAMQPTGEDAGG